MELAVSRPPVTISLENKPRDEEVAPRSAKREFLERLRTLRERAGGNLHRAQVRYKRNYDRTVMETNCGIVEGNEFYVRAETPQREQHSELESMVKCSYKVESNDGRTMLLRVGDDSVRVNSDRITRAPSTAVAVLNEEPNVAQTSPGPDESDEYVVERFVDRTDGPNVERLFRVLWNGYDEEDDTWKKRGKDSSAVYLTLLAS
jgi:hypothetical protein